MTNTNVLADAEVDKVETVETAEPDKSTAHSQEEQAAAVFDADKEATEKADKEATDKAEADKKADEEKDKKEQGAPEKYEDFTIPEGFEVDQDRLEAFSTMAKELNLNQEGAQKLIDAHAESMKLYAENQGKLWNETREKWVASAKSDKEYGGSKFNENVGLAKQALERFGTPELLDLAESYGMGDHPEFIRLLYRVGKAMGDDSMHNGIGKGSGPVDPAKVLFPNQN